MQEGLTKSTSKALSWSYAGSFVRLLLTFGVNILLTRLLGPKPFGLLAIAMLLFGLGNLLAGIGVTTALIQKPAISRRDIRFCFSVQTLLGSFAALILFLSAPAMAAFFRQQELTQVLRALAPLFLLQSFGATASALLSREQNTRSIQIASIISYLVAFLGLAVPMALMGYGIWSVVTAYLVQALINNILIYAMKRHSLVPLLHRDQIGLLKFGVSNFGANLSNWGISNLDNTFVGRMSGPLALGFYSRAFTLASLPAESVVMNLLQVLLPAFSRVQARSDCLRRTYIAAVGLVAIVLLPAFFGMAAVPGVVVLGLYGAKWAGAVRLFQPLALAIPVNALMALSGPLLAARGKPHVEMSLQFAVVLIAGYAFWFSVSHSVLWLSWTVLLVYLLRFALLTNAALREIGARWNDILRSIWPALVLAVFAASLASAIDGATPPIASGARLAVVVGGTAIPTLLLLVLGRNILLRPVLRNMPQFEDFLRTRRAHFAPVPPVEAVR